MSAMRWVVAGIALLAILFCASEVGAQPTVIFEDDFESYTAGNAPGSPWQNMFSGASCVVSTEQANSGSQSMRTESYFDWARWDYVQFPPPDALAYEASIRLSEAGKGGAVGFGFIEPGTTNTGWWGNAVHFAGDGLIYWSTRTAGDLLLGPWSPDTWYHVQVWVNLPGQFADVIVNGAGTAYHVAADPKVITGLYSAPVTLDKFGAFADNFPSGTNSVLYFDDMRLLNEGPLPTERSTWGAVKALYE